MKSIRFKMPLKLPFARMVASSLLVLLLVACGTTSATTGSAPTKAQTSSTVSKSLNGPLSLSLNPTNVSEAGGNLLVQSKYGFQCPYSDPALEGGQIDQLVLATDRTTYSQAEIAQMRAYIRDKLYVGALHFLDGGPVPPPTLRWVLGASTTSIPGESKFPLLCGATLLLTNTGNTPIQIPKIGARLKVRPQENAYSYRLVDACSLISCGSGPGGGPGDCRVYFASIRLGPGEQNAVFSAVPSHEDPAFGIHCGTLTIAPTAQVHLYIDFSFAPNTPKNLIYSFLPILTIDTVQGEQALALSQLVSTLVFAGINQFSCYGLQGTTFAPVKPFLGSPNWCI